MKKLLVALLLLATLFGCNNNTPAPAADVTKTGEFQTEADDAGNYVTATVTLVNDKITEVSIDSWYASSEAFKKDLGDDYGMRGRSEIGKEWFEQIAALEEWMVGKTIDEVLAMPFSVRDENHQEVPDVEELKTSVTITVGDYLAAVEGAVAAAVVVE